ncbi:hypothetical protein EIP91_002977 [Steccherinum ochraceum]|uniref:Uncharacterized protein n=1 Tax=Steccherinum ochraceum TaxID=92696 RepID=A0A4R0RCV0_9APHY|nr:hypothetical protein EIP91_002977 [Steccherinum ochraceum]
MQVEDEPQQEEEQPGARERRMFRYMFQAVMAASETTRKLCWMFESLADDYLTDGLHKSASDASFRKIASELGLTDSFMGTLILALCSVQRGGFVEDMSDKPFKNMWLCHFESEQGYDFAVEYIIGNTAYRMYCQAKCLKTTDDNTPYVDFLYKGNNPDNQLAQWEKLYNFVAGQNNQHNPNFKNIGLYVIYSSHGTFFIDVEVLYNLSRDPDVSQFFQRTDGNARLWRYIYTGGEEGGDFGELLQSPFWLFRYRDDAVPLPSAAVTQVGYTVRPAQSKMRTLFASAAAT